ncbi:bifunctional hydroxymethylpyrimidine kinase/phosphomethylpyrimidine kinase [Corynebacterium sp. MSK041]|uniref:bifunctional hydroxymethylpyrimidine kinase/phosphomethylpyrimidine kinase n=1 Tax=Corynebacterium sp. MSK041 TaxID=3050194 RepID=UPI002549D4DA|nr:bifunctional hydroxymethylpyrimidine kinase/phosphomethylpyrimidine kinase [Corynebacterium sp. MSK041]MDK8795633.1 bifunctional hydroxymethylpyrimidine kinase/phosphomethylpyrimidine kinase [Corynebacterium sp. MSK041]
MSDIRVPNKRIPNVLTIAGTDPSGGAGIQADLKAFSAAGAYGMSVITAVVAQNTQGVRAFQALDPDFVFDQAAAVFEDVQVDAVKIGMVANAGIIEAITKALDQYTDKATCPVVLDPVMVAKSGDSLLDADTEGALRDQLVPRSTLITPNLPEASVLLGLDEEMSKLDQMQEHADDLLKLGCDWVLLKGGHLEGHTSELSTDILIGPDTRIELTAPRIATTNDHGTGCTLSAAIAARLPRMDMESAVREAKEYLTAALKHADQLNVGHGHGPVHHFHNLWGNNA